MEKKPQPDTLAGNALSGRAAFSLTPKGKTEPVFGALWFTSRIEEPVRSSFRGAHPAVRRGTRWIP
jgi:hypothetical protein